MKLNTTEPLMINNFQYFEFLLVPQNHQMLGGKETIPPSAIKNIYPESPSGQIWRSCPEKTLFMRVGVGQT